MKKVLTFIGLKIAEVLAVITLVLINKPIAEFMFYKVFKYTYKMRGPDYLICGLLYFIWLGMILAWIGYVSYMILKTNWKLAGKITKEE